MISATVQFTLESGSNVEREVSVPAELPLLKLMTDEPDLANCMLITSAFMAYASLMAEDDVFTAKLSSSEYVVLFRHEVVAIARMVKAPHLEDLA